MKPSASSLLLATLAISSSSTSLAAPANDGGSSAALADTLPTFPSSHSFKLDDFAPRDLRSVDLANVIAARDGVDIELYRRGLIDALLGPLRPVLDIVCGVVDQVPVLKDAIALVDGLLGTKICLAPASLSPESIIAPLAALNMKELSLLEGALKTITDLAIDRSQGPLPVAPPSTPLTGRAEEEAGKEEKEVNEKGVNEKEKGAKGKEKGVKKEKDVEGEGLVEKKKTKNGTNHNKTAHKKHKDAKDERPPLAGDEDQQDDGFLCDEDGQCCNDEGVCREEEDDPIYDNDGDDNLESESVKVKEARDEALTGTTAPVDTAPPIEPASTSTATPTVTENTTTVSPTTTLATTPTPSPDTTTPAAPQETPAKLAKAEEKAPAQKPDAPVPPPMRRTKASMGWSYHRRDPSESRILENAPPLFKNVPVATKPDFVP